MNIVIKFVDFFLLCDRVDDIFCNLFTKILLTCKFQS